MVGLTPGCTRRRPVCRHAHLWAAPHSGGACHAQGPFAGGPAAGGGSRGVLSLTGPPGHSPAAPAPGRHKLLPTAAIHCRAPSHPYCLPFCSLGRQTHALLANQTHDLFQPSPSEHNDALLLAGFALERRRMSLPPISVSPCPMHTHAHTHSQPTPRYYPMSPAQSRRVLVPAPSHGSFPSIALPPTLQQTTVYLCFATALLI